MVSFRALYRERPPCSELRQYVRALFRFCLPHPPEGDPPFGPICPALFADAGSSIVVDLAAGWRVETLWAPGRDRSSASYVVGPMTRGWATSFGARVDAVGAYLRPGLGVGLLGVPSPVLAERIVALDDVWPKEGPLLREALESTADDEGRFRLLEGALMRRLRVQARQIAVDRPVIALACASEVGHRPPTVADLADQAGLSRQRFTRRFRGAFGMPPKVFLRLSRFRRLLQRTGSDALPASPWADMAFAFGYADQSHMIAEFREFTGLTPAALALSRAFHPFVSRASP
jgi:AraC-like DNA-binding protein